MNDPKLSIVIPSYNESQNIKKGVLVKVNNYLEKINFLFEVLIVDDGSTDDTAGLIKRFIKDKPGFRLLESTHGGKAVTVMRGLLKSEGDVVLFTDMDQATPLKEVENFFPKFEEGFDMVIGSRHGRKGAPPVRKLAAWSFSLLRRMILGLPFNDTQCGFKAFNRKSIEKIIPMIFHEWGVLHTKGGAVNAGFDVEVLYLAQKYGLKIAEVKVEWNYVDTERVQVIKDSLAAIYDILRIRWNDLTGKYD